MRKSPVIFFSLLAISWVKAQEPVSEIPQPAPVAVEAAAVPSVDPVAAPTPVPVEAPVPFEPPSDGGVRPFAPEPSAVPASPTVIEAGGVPGFIPPPAAEPVSVPVTEPTKVKPPTAPATSAASMDSQVSISKTVSEFQGDDVPQVLRLLSRQAGINLVVSDAVQGSITMRLEGLTPLEAMRVIITAKGLVMDQVDSVYYVKTLSEKAKEPTESGSYTFSYASAEKVVPLLTSQLQSGVTPMFDQRTNTIYFRELKSNLENVRLFLESIDRPTQQVMIEARLVEVNANPKQSYGINWAGVLGNSASGQTIRYGAGTALAPTTPENFALSTGGPNSPTGLGNLLGNQFAIISAPQLSVTLRLLNEDSDAEFLANPRIVTANNLKANIKITRNQPVAQLQFNEQTASSVFSGFEDKEFGNTLSVTPSINKDDFVTMLVKPEISNKVRDEVFTFGGASISSPVIDKRSLESTVLIKSGDTLAIGGLLQDETTKARAKVPVLGDIPVLGYAFQERLNQRTKRNLLIFVTPTIIEQGFGTGLESQTSGLKNVGEEYADPNGWRNNARGAVRLGPTSNRQLVSDYPAPGVAPAPVKGSVNYKVTAPTRDR